MKTVAEEIAKVEEAERSRRKALVDDDFETLRRLISRDITHTHTRGNTDDFDSFFAHVENRIRFISCERGPLNIRIVGDAAIMTGTMQSVVRLRDGDADIPVSAQVLQVWTRDGDRWVLSAFQATSLPS